MDNDKHSKDILIAGSSGIICSFLSSSINCKNRLFGLSKSGLEDKDHIQLDLTDEPSVNDFCNNCKYFSTIIFLVGLAHNKGNTRELDLYSKVNYQSLVNLLKGLKKVDKIPSKIIFASTISVYGERKNNDNYDEDLELKPLSPYAITKKEAEDYLLENYNTNSWILRFAPIYSKDFLLNIKRRTKFFCFYYKIANGKQKLSLCNIINIKLIVESIINENIPTGIYNVSDNKKYTYNELLKLQNPKFVISVPKFVIYFFYNLGVIFNNIFLRENSIKLMKDNVHSSKKISNFINLPWKLNDLIISND